MLNTLKERFEQKIELVPFSTCHWWVGALGRGGYGIFREYGRLEKAHRSSFKIYNGQIPRGAYILHKCDNPSCVNPGHLFHGSQKDNMDDMRAKGRAKEQQV